MPLIANAAVISARNRATAQPMRFTTGLMLVGTVVNGQCDPSHRSLQQSGHMGHGSDHTLLAALVGRERWFASHPECWVRQPYHQDGSCAATQVFGSKDESSPYWSEPQLRCC